MTDSYKAGYDALLNYGGTSDLDPSVSLLDSSALGSSSSNMLTNLTEDEVSSENILGGNLIDGYTLARDAWFKSEDCLAYNSGTGFFLGWDSTLAEYVFFIGNSAGNKLTWNGTTLAVAGAITASTIDIGGSDATSFHVDIDGNMWLGAATFATAISSISNAGLLSTISANIGGWNVVSGYIYNLQSGTPTATPDDGLVLASGNEAMIVYEDTAKRLEVGYLSAGIYGLRGYATDGTTTIFEVSDTQQIIAGWNFTDAVLRSGSTDANSNVLIDSTNSLIRLGPTTGNYLTLDGANLRVRTSTFAAGLQGWSIETDGSAEFANITARGEFHSQVLSYNEVHTTAGSQLIATSAGKLKSDVTSVTSPTTFNVDIDDPDTGHTQVFSASDILYVKDGSGNANYWTISSVSDQTTFFRYVCTKNDGSAATFRAGAAIVDLGQSGNGYLYLTADDANGPFYSVRTHTGSPWTTTIERLRVGNLNGYLGYVADTYGLGVGSNGAGEANITIDPTNGIRVRTGTTSLFSVDMTGGALIADWNITTGYLYGLSSGTPTATPNDGIVLKSGATGGVIVYEDTAKRVELGYLSAGIYGIKAYATNGTTVIFEASDAQQLLGGFTFTDSQLSATAGGNTTILSSGLTAFSAGPTGTPSVTITQAGVLTATGAVIAGTLNPTTTAVAGEDITAGDAVTIRTNEVVKSIATHDARVLESSAGTNFGSADPAPTGSTNATNNGDSYFFIKFDLSTIAVTVADKAFLRLNFTNAYTSASDSYELNAYQVTGADWDESTITWTNKPAINASIDGSWEFSENSQLTDDYLEESAGVSYVLIDITTLYNAWKGGTNNYGVAVRFVERGTGEESAATTANIDVRTSENATAALRPTLIVSGVSDNVGKVYKSNSANFTDLFGPSGISTTTTATSATDTIQRSGVATNQSGLTPGKTYFITDSETISTTAGTVKQSIGTALSATSISIDSDTSKIVIDNIIWQASGSSDDHESTNTIFVPIGFSPKIIRFDGAIVDDTAVSAASGVWYNGTQLTNTNDTITNGYLAYRVYDVNQEISMTVTSVFDSGVLFTIHLKDIQGASSREKIIKGILTFQS